MKQIYCSNVSIMYLLNIWGKSKYGIGLTFSKYSVLQDLDWDGDNLKKKKVSKQIPTCHQIAENASKITKLFTFCRLIY